MRRFLIGTIALLASAVVAAPIAAALAIGIFDTGCLLSLCGLEGLVYGGLGIWAALTAAGAALWLWWRRE